MYDPYSDVIANRYDYLSMQSIKFILKSLGYLESQIEDRGNNTRICVWIDINNAIEEANLTRDEEKILIYYYRSDYSLDMAAWESNISIGKASELNISLLKKIYKSLNGCDYVNE